MKINNSFLMVNFNNKILVYRCDSRKTYKIDISFYDLLTKIKKEEVQFDSSQISQINKLVKMQVLSYEKSKKKPEDT